MIGEEYWARSLGDTEQVLIPICIDLLMLITGQSYCDCMSEAPILAGASNLSLLESLLSSQMASVAYRFLYPHRSRMNKKGYFLPRSWLL
jgi:hypothetical protein